MSQILRTVGLILVVFGLVCFGVYYYWQQRLILSEERASGPSSLRNNASKRLLQPRKVDNADLTKGDAQVDSEDYYEKKAGGLTKDSDSDSDEHSEGD